MPKSTSQKKYCNCQISSDTKILKKEVNHSFCEKCGSILLKGANGTIYYTLKPKQKRLPYELNPINIFQSMKKMSEENYPNIKEDYNIDKSDKLNKDKIIKSINLYLKYRKMILLKLQKLMKTFDYCDSIFYQCLFFLDTYLSHDMNKETNEKTILYYLVGYFLCSLKLKETDIYEPSLDSFFDLSKGIYLSPDKIAYYEVLCVKNIKYNIFSYSAYDWISELISVGIVFNCEVNSSNEVILIKGHRHSLVNTLNKYCIKLLLNLTAKSIFFKYCPMYIALSLIQISREKYIDQSLINQKLFFNLISLFGVNQNDYKKCYEEIKNEMKEENNNNEKENKNQNEIDNIIEESQTIKKEVERHESTKKAFKKNKNLYVPNKIKSSNDVVHVKVDFNNISKNDDNSTSKDNDDKNSDDSKEKENEKEDKGIELTLNEIEINKKQKPKNEKENKNLEKARKKHLSIDCTKIGVKASLKSQDNLPHITFKMKEKNSFKTIIEEDKLGISQTKEMPGHNKRNKTKDLISLKTISNNKNNINNLNFSLPMEKNQLNYINVIKEKFAINANKNSDKINNTSEKPVKVSFLTSKKLPLVSNFEDLIKQERIDTNIAEINKENKSKNKKKTYKLKNTINNNDININLPESNTSRNLSNKKIVRKLTKIN